jgi:hypothetical protein
MRPVERTNAQMDDADPHLRTIISRAQNIARHLIQGRLRQSHHSR